ncbi:MAG: serine/threonine protein kinase, partial [Cyanobacteria bacterium]|nr:serine/threonine protein kinase [Cyanobacteriota bacterium]
RLRFMIELGEAIEYFHRQNWIHRDICPRNVILDEEYSIKLIDFGLVRAEGAAKFTATGVLLGSVSYMSTEQCQGKAIDGRTDIYSLAICFYEMLSGKRPYKGESPAAVISKHLTEPVPQIQFDQMDFYVPFINEIISKGMAKSPEDRFASMEDFSQALDTLSEKIEAAKPRPWVFKYYKQLLMGVASVLLLVCGLASFNAWRLHKESTEQALFTLTPQGRLENSIDKLREKTDRTSKDNIALGRLLMQSKWPKNHVAAVQCFTDALREARPGDRALCFVLRAKANLNIREYNAAESDFTSALAELAGDGNQDRRDDVLLERVLLRLKTGQYAAALKDYAPFVRHNYTREGASLIDFAEAEKLTRIMDGHLDPIARTRYAIMSEIIGVTIKLHPNTEAEAVELLRMSNRLAIGRFKTRSAVKDDNLNLLSVFSRYLMPKFSGNEKLKKDTVRMLGDMRAFIASEKKEQLYFIDVD